MAYDLAKVTANGNNLIAQILANKSSLSIDKIEISDTQLPSTTDISTMTSVPKVVQTVSANGFSKNSNTLIISTVVDNSSIRADYKAWVFGIWGSDSQNGQSQLIAVITSTNSPDTIPAFSGRTPVSYTYKFNIGFSNASQIQFNMIDDSFATNDTVVHTTGNETIDGQKKFGTDPIDAAGNAYAKTVDVNQQLDKKVNVSDMRKPASDVAGIEEVNAKQDKIGYTPADDSKVVHHPISKSVTDMNNEISDGLFFNTNLSALHSPFAGNAFYYQVFAGTWSRIRQIAYADLDASKTVMRISSNNGSTWSDWKFEPSVDDNGVMTYGPSDATIKVADDSKVVHSTNMRKPASEVASINEVVKDNGDGSISFGGLTIPFKGTVTGDFNNYMKTGLYTYSTANGAINNSIGEAPDGILIVLSQTNGNVYHFLISAYSERYFRVYMASAWHDWHKQLFIEDLTAGLATKADDSKVAHLSGANNFDTVPTVDNNPLLLASSLPSDLARTGQANTFTAAQTFSIAPTIKDASKDKGDNQAATMADLKSVENSAWCIAHTGTDYLMLYQKSSTQVWVFGTLPDAMDLDKQGFAFTESSNVLGIPSRWNETGRSHDTWHFYQIGELNNSFDKLKSTYFEVYPNFISSFGTGYFVNYGYLCIKNKILYIGLYGKLSDNNLSFNAGASINAKVPLTSN